MLSACLLHHCFRFHGDTYVAFLPFISANNSGVHCLRQLFLDHLVGFNLERVVSLVLFVFRIVLEVAPWVVRLLRFIIFLVECRTQLQAHMFFLFWQFVRFSALAGELTGFLAYRSVLILNWSVIFLTDLLIAAILSIRRHPIVLWTIHWATISALVTFRTLLLLLLLRLFG